MYYKKNDIYLNVYQRLLKEQEQFSIDQVIELPSAQANPTQQIDRIKKNNLILDIILKLFEINDQDISKFYTLSQLDKKLEQSNRSYDLNRIKKVLEDFAKECSKATDDKDGSKIVEATKTVKSKIAKIFPNWSVLQWFLINWLKDPSILDSFIDKILENKENFVAINNSSFFIPKQDIIKVSQGSELVELLNKNPLKKEQTQDLTKSLLKNNIEDSNKTGVWDWIVDGFDNVIGTLFPDLGGYGSKFSDSVKDYTKNLNLAMGRKKDDPTVVDEFFKELQKNPDKITGADALKHVMILSAKGQKPSQQLLDKAAKEFEAGLTKKAKEDDPGIEKKFKEYELSVNEDELENIFLEDE